MKRFEELAGKGMRPATALPRRAMQSFHRVEKPERFPRVCCFAETQRAEPLEMPHRAPELLARIGAEHRIELSTAVLEPAELDRVGRDGRFAASKPISAQHDFWQTAQRATDVKFVRFAVQTGEPGDELAADGSFQL